MMLKISFISQCQIRDIKPYQSVQGRQHLKKRGAWLTHISDCFKDRKCVIREITQSVIGDDQYEIVDIRWSGRLV